LGVLAVVFFFSHRLLTGRVAISLQVKARQPVWQQGMETRAFTQDGIPWPCHPPDRVLSHFWLDFIFFLIVQFTYIRLQKQSLNDWCVLNSN
jgi:hypothetical protein